MSNTAHGYHKPSLVPVHLAWNDSPHGSDQLSASLAGDKQHFDSVSGVDPHLCTRSPSTLTLRNHDDGVAVVNIRLKVVCTFHGQGNEPVKGTVKGTVKGQ